MKKIAKNLSVSKFEPFTKLRMFNNLFANYYDVVFLIGYSGEFIEINHNIETLFGYSRHSILNSPFTDYIYFVDRIKVIKYFNEALTGKVAEKEFRVVHKDGTIQSVRVTAGAVTIDQHSLGIFGVGKVLRNTDSISTIRGL